MRVHEAVLRLKFGEVMVRVGLRGHLHAVVKRGEIALYCDNKIWNPSDADLTSTTWEIRTVDENRKLAVQMKVGALCATKSYETVDRSAIHQAVAEWVDGAIDKYGAYRLDLSYLATPGRSETPTDQGT